MIKIKLEQFEGPLDLLLKLTEENELDITQVSLAAVADQFIQYLNEHQDIHLEELADFLVVAAKLLLIKSRVLIPSLQEDEEETDLENQLKIYRGFYEASKILNKIILKKKWAYGRELKKVRSIEPIFNPPKSLNAPKLKQIILDILKELEPVVNLPQRVIEKTVSIKEKIAEIQKQILETASLNFKTLLESSVSRTEVIVTFLAILELIKQKTIYVIQDEMFEDIKIEKSNE